MVLRRIPAEGKRKRCSAKISLSHQLKVGHRPSSRVPAERPATASNTSCAPPRQMAAHASTRTTQLYDRREDRVTLDEVVKSNIRGQTAAGAVDTAEIPRITDQIVAVRKSAALG